MVTNIFALDIGEKRIGIARANSIAKLAQPVTTIANDASFSKVFKALVEEYDISAIVVGLPRNLLGEETKQSAYTRSFVAEHLQGYTIYWQDETLSTKTAEDRRNKKDTGAIDAYAACVILEDYLEHI